MAIRLASSGEPGAVSIRDFLAEAGNRAGTDGDDLVIEVVQWGILLDEHQSEGNPPPTIEDYAERYERTPDEVTAHVAEFLRSTGVEPRRFWEIEEEALKRVANDYRGGAVLDEVYVVAE